MAGAKTLVPRHDVTDPAKQVARLDVGFQHLPDGGADVEIGVADDGSDTPGALRSVGRLRRLGPASVLAVSDNERAGSATGLDGPTERAQPRSHSAWPSATQRPSD